MKKSSILILVAIIAVLGLALVACSSSEPAASTEPSSTGTTAADTSEASTLEGTINISGSTSVLPLAQELAYAFEEIHPDVRVNVNGGGSSQGVKDASTGVSDIGNASRNLKESEEDLGLEEHVIAYDGIAVVVHPNNPVDDLTAEQITAIYKGEITNWSEVGGNDEEIVVVSREDGSGTRGAFEEIMDLEGDNGSLLVETALIFNGNGGVKAAVAGKENAIGYVSLAYLDESLKPVSVDGVEPTVENIKAGTYPVSRPFLMLTNGDTTEVTDAFIEFVLTDGQEIVAESYITVN